jgi:primase-polymerase (primpol)-like protein
MNSDIRNIVKWAVSQGWRVEDDSKGYTRFFNREGEYITNYPATPSNPYRRRQSLLVNLKKAGLPWPAPSKKEQRSQRKKGETT